jgi:soluble lytic murein transglycosylase-like protein
MKHRLLPLLGRGLVGLLTLGVALLLAGMIQLLAERGRAQALPDQNPDRQDTIILAETGPANVGAPKFWSPAPAVPAPNNPLPKLSPADMSYEEMFQEVATRHNLDWRLLAELAYQESLMDPWALGQDNDMGMMQIIPRTWNEFAPEVGVTDPFDAYSNIQVGAAYLAYMREFTHARGYTEDVWMVVGYNWGPDNLDNLFANNGDWAQVPVRQRNYALAIVEAAYNETERWKDVSAP